MGITASRATSVVVAAAFLLVAAAQAREAHPVAAAPSRLAILGARVDRDAGTLTITGRGLAAGSAAPSVTLGGAPLVVSSASPDTIVAQLPASVEPGSLLLTVALPQGNQSDSFSLAIPATDIVTPAGIRIESTGSDVRIIAGTSRITVDPSGGVTIDTDDLEVRAAGAIDMRGQSVDIQSATSMTLRAGTTLTVDGGAAANVRSQGQVEVRGSIVKLN